MRRYGVLVKKVVTKNYLMISIMRKQLFLSIVCPTHCFLSHNDLTYQPHVDGIINCNHTPFTQLFNDEVT